jgi:hypothetical protein
MSEALKQQREQQGAIVPVNKAPLATNGGSSPAAAYLAAHGVGMTGTFFKFAKDGVFRKTSDDEELEEGATFRLIYDQIQTGWIKFMGKEGDHIARRRSSPRSGKPRWPRWARRPYTMPCAGCLTGEKSALRNTSHRTATRDSRSSKHDAHYIAWFFRASSVALYPPYPLRI